MEKDKFTIKDLDLFYGDFQALKKISMHIPEKEITAFIGPSGCGKSTLLKSLNRMNDLVEGCKITGTLPSPPRGCSTTATFVFLTIKYLLLSFPVISFTGSS